LASCAGPTNPIRPEERPAQLTPSAGDRVAIQSGDAGQQGDAARAVLAGEEAGYQAAGALVGSGDKAIEGTMLPGHSAAGMLSAARARTSVDEAPTLLVGQTFLGDHRTLPPFRQPAKGGKVILFSHC